jgi:hypothetical protein
MQIQLKQTEIIAALKQYIVGQGISLNGKSVDISFTAGRKEAGITADISIEDANAIPGFEDSQEEAAKPVLTVVPTPPETKAAEPEAPAVEEPPFVADDVPVAKTPTSLFN